jgi:hypothetical protein
MTERARGKERANNKQEEERGERKREKARSKRKRERERSTEREGGRGIRKGRKREE